MDTWINAQAKAAQGHKMIKGGLDLIQESIEIMERVNATEVSVRQIEESKTERKGRGLHDEQSVV
jgi:hypothetical protein